MDVNSTITGPDVQRGFHPQARYEFKVHFDGADRVAPAAGIEERFERGLRTKETGAAELERGGCARRQQHAAARDDGSCRIVEAHRDAHRRCEVMVVERDVELHFPACERERSSGAEARKRR